MIQQVPLQAGLRLNSSRQQGQLQAAPLRAALRLSSSRQQWQLQAVRQPSQLVQAVLFAAAGMAATDLAEPRQQASRCALLQHMAGVMQKRQAHAPIHILLLHHVVAPQLWLTASELAHSEIASL